MTEKCTIDPPWAEGCKRVSIRKIRIIIDRCYPYGRFLAKDGPRWIAVDNSTGDAWTEDFSNKHDAVRWLRGEFEISDMEKEVNSMKILVIEPLKRPRVKEISGTLRSMQEIVGGNVQAIHSFQDSVNVITCDVGKLMDQPMNRVLRDKNGHICDVICGAFIICGIREDDFISLTDEQVKRYMQMLCLPEVFLHIGGRIMVLQILDEEGEQEHEG